MERFREIMKLSNNKTKPFSTKMLGPDEEDDNKLVDIIKKYFIETSIHGFKYIFENGRHIFERLFWLIAVSVMASCGFYLIYQVSFGNFIVLFAIPYVHH